jgi:hypothetical protein
VLNEPELSDLAARIDWFFSAEEADRAAALLEAYYAGDNFTGGRWDPVVREQLAARPYGFGPEDFWAPTLLSAALDRRSSAALLRVRHRVADRLEAIPPSAELLDPAVQTAECWVAAAYDAYDLVLSCPRIGPTRAHKLLAGRRPDLVPIYDSRIGAALGVGSHRWWSSLRAALVAGSALPTIRDLAESFPAVSTLRIIDVVIWMRTGGYASLGHGALKGFCRSHLPPFLPAGATPL